MIQRSSISPQRAVEIALAAVGTCEYQLGATHGDKKDCVGFAWEECYGMPRHIDGLNRKGGGIGDVEDDANTNSLIGDADTDRDVVERIDEPELGCLIMYPTIRLEGHPQPWIGHVGIVVGLSRYVAGDWSTLDTVQCCGPNGRRPGVLALPGYAFAQHDKLWPKPEHRSVLLRVLQA
jgi:hypothetical protein